jgi:DME family drug/metabolite transporter
VSTRRGLLFAAAGYASWGLLSPGNEILLVQQTPMWMQFIRSLIASIVLVAWLGVPGIKAAWKALHHRRLRIGLFMGTFLSFALFALSQDRLPATFATLGFYTAPLWTALLGRMWLGEQVGKWYLPAVAFMGLGAWLALTGGGALPWPDGIGLAMAIGAGLTWAVFSVMLRRSSADVEWRALLLASMMLALPLFAVLAVVFEPTPILANWDALTWRWTFIQVAIPTLLAMGLFQLALRHADASKVNLLVGLELAGTVVFARILLGDQFTGLQLLGIVVALAAVSAYLWQTSRPAARRDSG